MNYLPIEVWELIISYLQLNNVIKFSCVCKDFYHLSRANSFYMKKLKEPNRIFQDKSDVVSAYSNLCKEFYLAVFRRLTPFVKRNHILMVKSIIHNELFYAILPFRVWNHLFLCVRSQYESYMSMFCTKMCLRNRKLSSLVGKNLIVDILDYFPVQLSYGIISSRHVHLFVYSSVMDRQKLLADNSNFGILFYEVINSPFMLLKFYLDILARIVFNYCDKHILTALLSDLKDNCWDFTVCNSRTCFNIKKIRNKNILFELALTFSKKLAEYSCRSVDSYFIIDVFNNYEQGVDFRNQYLTIETYRDECFL